MKNRKISVAHITYSYLPVTQNWIHNQIIQNDKCESYVICQYRENNLQFPFKNVYPIYPNVNIFTKFLLLLSRLWIWYPKHFYNRALLEIKPDIVHGHFSHESWRVLPIVKKRQIPLITTFYGLDVNKLPKRSFWKKRYPLIFDYGCAFIVEGNFMKSQLVSLGCPSEKIKVVHLGVDIPKIEAITKRVKDQNALVKILFVGLEREKKGPIDAIRAFIKTAQAFPDVELNIIGDGKYRNIVEKISIENGVREKVIFHGYVKVDTYLDLLANCDIVFAPSCNAADGDTEGGAPVVLLEAQAAGKPVVSTFHCDIPEVVKDGVSGLLSAEHDIQGLSDNLLRFCKSKELRDAFGAAGKEHIKENHDIRKQVNVLADIYYAYSSLNK